MVPFAIKLLCMQAYQGPALYDNTVPRTADIDVIFKTSPSLGAFVKRCKSAHENGMENLGYFGTSVAIAKACGVASLQLNPLVETYLLGRIVYTCVYLGNVNNILGYVRSVVYFSGIATILEMFHLAALALESHKA
jgi:uncharacterized MAPEG superfamily protein